MRLSRITAGLALLLALVGCSSTEGEPQDEASPSADSSSPDDSTQGAESGAESLNFRPLLARRPADAGAPADAPKKMRKAFAETDCTEKPATTKPAKPVVACDADDQKYLLGPAVVTDSLTAASAVEFEGEWVVAVVVDKSAQEDFASFADEGDGAAVLALEQGGVVLDVRSTEQLVDKGRTAVTGDLTQDDAEELAKQLTATIEE